MNSPGGRAVVGVLALAVIVALFFVLRDGGDDEPSTTEQTEQTATGGDANEGGAAGSQQDGDQRNGAGGAEPEIPTIVVRGGEPVGGVAELSYTVGERIRFAVESDVADHVHLHGYDVFKDIEAGGRVTFDVPATIDGVFEVELEDRVVPLAEITVNPG